MYSFVPFGTVSMNSLKKLIFALVILVMVLPMVQAEFKFFPKKKITGFFKLTPEPEPWTVSKTTWFNSTYQTGLSTNLEDHIGLRNYFFILHNQYDYSLFGMTHALGFISGKDRMLFEEDYIKEYTGASFIGKKSWDKKIARLNEVRQKLKASGTTLLLIFEPGKASFYPEYIPEHYQPKIRTLTNYDYLKEKLTGLSFPFLDLNRDFLEMKDTSRYPLFPKYGMHWSIYGMACAVNPMADFIRREAGVNLPSFKIAKITVSDSLRYSDNDIGSLLNLICPLPKVKAAYPELIFGNDTAGRPKSVLVIADSYYATFEDHVAPGLFGKDTYWYYNSKVYPHTIESDNPVFVDKSNLSETLEKYDLILLMSSEINLHSGFWNFPDEAWLSFHPGVQEDSVYIMENKIRNSREWFRFMIDKAKKQHKTLEQEIRNDAEYVLGI